MQLLWVVCHVQVMSCFFTAGATQAEEPVLSELGGMQLPGGALGYNGTFCQMAKIACYLDVVR